MRSDRRRAFFAGAVVASVFIVSPGVWNDCQPLASLALLLCGFALFWAGRSVQVDAISLAGAALAVSVLTIPVSGPWSRPGGYYHNPNLAGSALAIMLMPALHNRRLIYAAIIFAGLLFTVSVGAIAGAAAGALVLSYNYTPFRKWVTRVGWRYILAAALIAVAALGFLAQGERSYWLHERPALWARAVKMIAAHPLTGNGAGAYWLSQNLFLLNPFWARRQVNPPPHAHNLYLQVGADYGLIVLAGVLLIAVAVYRRSGPAARAAIITVAAHGLVDAPVLYLSPAFVLWLVVYNGGAFSRHPQHVHQWY